MMAANSRDVRAVVFDLDGTLIDSAPDLQAALNSVLEEKGRRRLDLEEVKHMIGDGVLKLLERAFAATGVPVPGEELPVIACRFLDFYEGHDADFTRTYEGVPETLARLRDDGIVMGVCTNKPFQATEDVLRKLDLRDYFVAVLGGDSLPGGIRKPDPRHIGATLKAMNADPATAVVVGDHPNDIASARAARVPVVAVSYGYSRKPIRELKPNAVIDAFADLPAALRQLA